jgi:hypothetical protein
MRSRGLTPLTPDPGASQNGRLPRFPEFTNSWDPSVQLKWLDVYGSLAAPVHKKE